MSDEPNYHVVAGFFQEMNFVEKVFLVRFSFRMKRHHQVIEIFAIMSQQVSKSRMRISGKQRCVNRNFISGCEQPIAEEVEIRHQQRFASRQLEVPLSRGIGPSHEEFSNPMNELYIPVGT